MDYNKSMMTVAEEILKANGAEMSFKDLWDKVKESVGISPEEEEERVGYFYTDISLARSTFVVLTNNKIDLRSRLEYKKYRIAYEDIDSTEEEEGKDDVDKKEEEETDSFVNSGVLTHEDNSFDTGATDGEGLEDNGKDVAVNDYIRSGNSDNGSNF